MTISSSPLSPYFLRPLFAARVQKNIALSLIHTRKTSPLRLYCKSYPSVSMSETLLVEDGPQTRSGGPAKRTAVAALLAIPWSKDLIRKIGTRNLSVVMSATASRPFLTDISHHLRRAIFEFWRADLSHWKGRQLPEEGCACQGASLFALFAFWVEESFLRF